MQIVVQLLAFYLLTFSILFFAFVPTPFGSFLFLLILNSLMSFINRFQLIAIACASCFLFLLPLLLLLLLLLLLPLSERTLNTNVLCWTRALTSHCIANHLNINNPIIPIAFSLSSSIFLVRCDWESPSPFIRSRVSVYRCHYFEFYGFDFECWLSVACAWCRRRRRV